MVGKIRRRRKKFQQDFDLFLLPFWRRSSGTYHPYQSTVAAVVCAWLLDRTVHAIGWHAKGDQSILRREIKKYLLQMLRYVSLPLFHCRIPCFQRLQKLAH